ncbi:MAG: SpoIIE family protein phosphatase [Rhodospirillales bacterium]|nr:SpoIIE family protein phosphatase [Rhodospirillales bacterium]
MSSRQGDSGKLSLGRFSLRSFRAKFVLVVGAAVVFDLAMSGGVSIWNMQRLSEGAREEISEGLTQSTEQFLQTSIEMTTSQADLLLERVHSEVTMLANGMQLLIDHPDVKGELGAAIAADPDLTSPLVYSAEGGWSQNLPGAPSAVSVWGYLLDENRRPLPSTAQEIQDSKFLDLMGPAVMKTGAPKLQVYYVGPKHASILRATPYSEQAQTFDKLYPGHNEGPNFWDFFFPGVYEGWQAWLTDPDARQVDSNIVMTEPYVDAITGILIVSFFHPLWTADRTDVAGMVAVDITLDQLTSLVESITIADTGFGYLLMSNGNVIAINESGEATIGLVASEGGGQGVTGIDRSIRNSVHPAIADMQLPTGSDVTIQHLTLDQNGEDTDYLIVQKQLRPTNLWNVDGIGKENMTVGFVVSEEEVYQLLTAVESGISDATSRIYNLQIAVLLVSLLIVFFAVYAISGRITAGLSALASAARSLERKDYSVRVNIPTRDEVGKVGVAFNSMVQEIQYHTENLENLVEERTRNLEEANREIVSLNQQLRSENLRLGAELDVAHRIQKMVLPRVSELDQIPKLEIAGYMEPADEVGGDYYDVLQDGSRIKVGIGDVTGHGLESGVLMLMVQSVARALYEKGDQDNERFLEIVNRAIFKNIERTESDKHLTLAFVDYEENEVTLTGQHEEVLLVRSNGSLERIDTMDLGFPIGLEFDIAQFIGTRKLNFLSGDTLILHTDGVTEAENLEGELFGLERLCESAKQNSDGSAVDVVNGIVMDLKSHIGTQKIHDDITLVVMRHR